MSARADHHFPCIQPALIARLKSTDGREAVLATAEICARFYSPLYAYLRHRGLDHHDAQDVLHDFFARLLRTHALATVDEQKGSMGSLLAVSLQRHLINWWHRRKAQNREISLEETATASGPESRCLNDRLRDTETPARQCERKCAQELLDHVLRRLGTSYSARGMGTLFKVLKPVLLHGGSLRGEDSLALAQDLRMTAGALRTRLSRLLRDYRELLEHEMLKSVENIGEVKEEVARMRELFVRG